jgi:hypothetical protein
MWFAIALLEERGEELLVTRVMPENEQKEVWRGFSSADTRLLLAAYTNRKPLSGQDRQLATFLWQPTATTRQTYFSSWLRSELKAFFTWRKWYRHISNGCPTKDTRGGQPLY